MAEICTGSERSEGFLSTEERHVAAGAQVLRTPLADWSDINRESGELHVAVGRAYAFAMAYGEPSSVSRDNLLARARRLLELLEARR